MKKGKKNLLIKKLFNKLLRILIKKTKLSKSLRRKRRNKLFKSLRRKKKKKLNKRKRKKKEKLKSNTSLFIKHGWLGETFTFPSR